MRKKHCFSSTQLKSLHQLKSNQKSPSASACCREMNLLVAALLAWLHLLLLQLQLLLLRLLPLEPASSMPSCCGTLLHACMHVRQLGEQQHPECADRWRASHSRPEPTTPANSLLPRMSPVAANIKELSNNLATTGSWGITTALAFGLAITGGPGSQTLLDVVDA